MRHYQYKIFRSHKLKLPTFYYSKHKFFNKCLLYEFRYIYNFSYLFYKRFYKRVNKISTYKNYCSFTGRSRSYVSFLSCSRMVFKKFALNGFFIGIRKGS